MLLKIFNLQIKKQPKVSKWKRPYWASLFVKEKGQLGRFK